MPTNSEEKTVRVTQNGEHVADDSRKKTKLPRTVDWQALAQKKQAELAEAAEKDE